MFKMLGLKQTNIMQYRGFHIGQSTGSTNIFDKVRTFMDVLWEPWGCSMALCTSGLVSDGPMCSWAPMGHFESKS